MEINYKLVRSKRKTVSLTIDKMGNIIVKAGLVTPEQFIKEFVNKNADWIEKQQQKRLVINQSYNPLAAVEIKALKTKAKSVLSEKTRVYSQLMGVLPTGIKITSATTRWGSCSFKNAICYSYRVMLLPEECQDYIVFHELSHIRVKNHSGKFYQELGKYFPNYKEIQKKIKSFKNFDLP